jgi:hypothetical protein
MEPDRESYRFAGYLVTERVEGDEFDERLPTPFITTSPCLARFVPDTWSLAWTSDTTEDREKAAARLGLNRSNLQAITALVTAGFDDGRFGWPNVVMSTEGLVALMALLPPARRWVAVGLGLHHRHISRFLDWTAPPAGAGADGGHILLARGTPLPAGGRALGFELLGIESPSAQPHSWLCNRLDLTFADTLGARSNSDGLLATEAEAEAATAQIAEGKAPCEPGLWLPFLLIDYTREGGGGPP